MATSYELVADRYVIEAQTDYEELVVCCSPGSVVKNGSRTQYFRDVPINGKPVRIVIQRQRSRCQSCGATFYNRISGLEERRRMTTRLYSFITSAAKQYQDTEIALIVGLSTETVRNIKRQILAIDK